MLTLIVAMNQEGGIGLDGTLPWHHSNDLKHFKKTTLNQKVVMGRKTLENMPKILEQRDIFCVTKQEKISLKSSQPITIINDFEGFCKKHQHSNSLYFIAGGGSIYKSALPYVTEMIVSFVDYEGDIDTYFPSFVFESFKIVNRKKMVDFEVVTYRR